MRRHREAYPDHRPAYTEKVDQGRPTDSRRPGMPMGLPPLHQSIEHDKDMASSRSPGSRFIWRDWGLTFRQIEATRVCVAHIVVVGVDKNTKR